MDDQTYMVQKVINGQPIGKVVSFVLEEKNLPLVKEDLLTTSPKKEYLGILLAQAIFRLNEVKVLPVTDCLIQ